MIGLLGFEGDGGEGSEGEGAGGRGFGVGAWAQQVQDYCQEDDD